MTGEMIFVFGVLAGAVVLFVSDRVRLDIVAIMVILALTLGGIVTAREAVAGFGDPIIMLIAGLFVVGEGLSRTGVALAVGNWLMRVGGNSEIRLIILLMLTVAVLSAFMSSTGAVAIFIPVVLSLAAKIGVGPGKLLLPLAFASLMGGMLTLIGTPPNLVVSQALAREGLDPFSFFAFTPIGLVVLAVGIVYLVTIGRKLLPADSGRAGAHTDEQTLDQLVETYGVKDQLHRLRIDQSSPLVGKTLVEAGLRSRYGVTVFGIERKERFAASVMPALTDSLAAPGDVIYVIGPRESIDRLVEPEKLEPLPLEEKQVKSLLRELGVAEVMLTPQSWLNGQTLRDARFRSTYGLSVIAVWRKGEGLGEALADTKLEFGDTLLVGGGWEQIRLLYGNSRNFLVLSKPAELAEVAPSRRKAPLAIAIMLGMLLLMTFNVVPSVIAVIIAAFATVVLRCISMEDAYRAINWQSLVLIAGMLPLATALDKTGGIALIVDGLVTAVGDLGPFALMTGLFVITSLLSQFISNTATAVLVAPIGIAAAGQMDVSPYPLLMTIAIAASTAFATPVASPVNTLVLGPGNYRFNDFVKIGVPLQLLALVVTLATVPLIFPL